MPTVDVLDSTIHYRQSGAADGTPVVFLHGNPTSSHLWRKVLPRIGPGLRCVAPDLIGMGRSGKPDIAYTFADHARYLDAFLATLDAPQFLLVGQDWGGALAFDWAARHPGRTLGLAFLETIMRPMSWDDFPAAARTRFESFRTPGLGEELVLDQNAFLESFGQSALTGLSEEAAQAYRAPFPTPASRRPILQWARSMPLEGEPADVIARITAYDAWLAASTDVPKLLLTFDSSPTLMIDERMAAWCEQNVAALSVRHCGPAGHLAPEDQPEAIAAAVTGWARENGFAGPAAVLNPRIVGQAENAHAAVLTRALKGTGIDREQWIALNVALGPARAAADGANPGIPAGVLAARTAGALKVDRAQARGVLATLAAAGLLTGPEAASADTGSDDTDPIHLTDAGREFIATIRGEIRPILTSAYDDIPAEDLHLAAHVLAIVTERLDEALAGVQSGGPAAA